MILRFAWLSPLALLVGLWGARGLVAEDGKAPTTPVKKEKPAGSAGDSSAKLPTSQVEKGTLRAEITLKGTFEPEMKTEVSIKPKAWSQSLVVKKAIEHGARVKKGDVLVEIDPEKIDRAIHELKMDRDLSEIALRQAEEELPVLEKNLPLDLEAAERSKKQADEDLQKFLAVNRPLVEETINNTVRNMAYFVEYAKEELKQLQKMYRNKDLTEETEEIILKRQRHMVEMAEFSLKSAKVRQEEALKVSLPRQEQALREAVAKQTIAWDKARNTLQLVVNQKRLSLQKLKYEYERTLEKLDNLLKDRELFTVRAPADGIVYYGKCTRGEWTAASTVRAKLHPGGTLSTEEVFMTLLSPRPLLVHAAVEEKDLHLFRTSMKGRAVPVAYPDLKLRAQLLRVSNVPESAGSFQACIRIEASKSARRLMPGMACTIRFTAFDKKDVLTVPAGAVFTDEDNDEGHYVYLASKTGKPEKRPVRIGASSNGKTEILGGLSEGDEVLTSKPS
jgi:multidrug efflux pump subunit AcrA (membrane-fusion protein)